MASFPLQQAGNYTLVVQRGAGKSCYVQPDSRLLLSGWSAEKDDISTFLSSWRTTRDFHQQTVASVVRSSDSLPTLASEPADIRLAFDAKSPLSYYSLQIPAEFVGGAVLMALEFDPEAGGEARARSFPVLSDPLGHEVVGRKQHFFSQAFILANDGGSTDGHNHDHDHDNDHEETDTSGQHHHDGDHDSDHDHGHDGHGHDHNKDHDHDHDQTGSTSGQSHEHDHDHDHGSDDHDHEGHTHSHSHGACDGHSHSHSQGSSSEPESAWVQVSKGLAILCVLLSAIGGVLLRMKCPTLQSPAFFSYINVLSGGMFIAMGLFHILPESIEHQPCSMGTLFTKEVSGMGVVFFTFIGFMMVLLFERVLFDAHGNSHSHDEHIEEDVKNILNPRRSFIARAVESTEPSMRTHSDMTLRRASLSRSASNSFRANPAPSEIEMNEGGAIASGASAPRTTNGIADPHGAEEHGHGHEHAHGHEHGDDHRSRGGFGAILLMAALSVHSLFEGIVIGTADTATLVWLLAAIVVAHKWAAAFSVANQLSADQKGNRLAQGLLAIFCLASPLGSILGWSVNAMADTAESEGPAFVQTLLNSIAVGTLFYIGFVEVIPEEFTGPKDAVKRFCVLFASAMFVFGLTLLHMAHGHKH